MDEQIRSRLLAYLDELEKAMSSGADFAAEQAPLLVQEYLAWRFWDAVMFAMLGAALMLFALVTFCKLRSTLRKWFYSTNPDDSVACIFTGVILAGAAVGGFLTAGSNVRDAIKVKVAPRVILVEEAARLAKLGD